MFRFMLGVACSAVFLVVLARHPDVMHRGLSAAKEKIAGASRNVWAAASGERSENHKAWRACEQRSTAIDVTRARALVPELRSLSSDALWGIMDEPDFDRRAAAGAILLQRAGIPASENGVDEIKRRYFRSGRPEDLQTGFSYLGLLACQGVPEPAVVLQAQRFVERYPQHAACDNAIWALGELGSENLVPYFFQIIENSDKYGPAARERAFCCLVQCGRYTPAQRIEMVPKLIEIYEQKPDSQTRSWTMRALAYCAPGVRARSIHDWKTWWARQ